MLRSLPLILLGLVSLTAIAQPNSAIDYFNEGKRLMDDKKYDQAYSAFKNAVLKDANYKEALYEAGWCANELEKYSDAIKYLAKAKTLDAFNKKVLFELGYAYKHFDNPNEALNNFKKLLDIDPDNSDASMYLGDIYYDRKEYASALSYYRKYLEDDEAENAYYYKAAWCSNDLEKYQQAIDYMNKYFPDESDDKAKKFAEIGYANYKLENAQAAVDAYKRSLTERPGYGTALRGLGDVYDQLLKQNEDAITYYEMAVQKDPDNSKRCYYTLGWLYNDEEKYDDAATILQKAVQYKPHDKDNRIELGFAYYKLKKYDDALVQLKKAVELDENSKLGYYYQGLCYIDLQQKSKAREIYTKLKTIDEEQAKKLLDKYNETKD
jgi:tetratricopeptide (TPR) repeat protein